ncbi:MAG: ATP-binding cassette domain-containing protein, partial [Chloroflexi bacterium]|nr:ATP-binding cassette domain-containing protein [Chloroflexota bacterium]
MPEQSAPTPLVELRGVTKRFGELVANDAVDLTLEAGEIHALLGENGAGKTTLMRVLYGLTGIDAGEIRVQGRPVTIRSPADAIALGIGMVTQHFALVLPMTVAENLALGRGTGVRLDLGSAERLAEESSERIGIRVDPRARVADLSIGERQRVEILKALSRDCRLLILDEPTAVLVPQEVEGLFETLRRLAADGMAVVFI